MKIKIIKEKDGKTVVIDTTFTGNGMRTAEEMKEFVDSLNSTMQELEHDLKNMEIDLSLDVDEFLDNDSLLREVEKMVIVDSDGKTGHVRIHGIPDGHGYQYKFDIQDNEFPFEWESGAPPCFEFEHELNRADMHRMIRSRIEGGSLNELLGNIPLEKVKSYSVKDRKNGKRIVIDIEDGPFFDVPHHTVMMKSIPRSNKDCRGTRNDVKVIIKDMEEGSGDKQTSPADKKDDSKSNLNGKEKI